MFEIEDDACGFLRFDEDKCHYKIHKGIVTVYTYNSDFSKLQEYLEKMRCSNRFKYLFGQDDKGYFIVMVLNKTNMYTFNINADSINIKFTPSMIIESSKNSNYYSNLEESWG